MSVMERSARLPDVMLSYGEHPQQLIDVWLPRVDVRLSSHEIDASTSESGVAVRGLVLCLHGGFWREQYDRSHLAPMAEDLASRGYIVAVPEYRRVRGDGGWPATFDDVASVVERGISLVRHVLPVEWRQVPVVLVGHSAGGHLALWVMQRGNLPVESRWRDAEVPPVAGVVALAPVADLARAHRLGLSNDAVVELLGGTPEEVPERYVATDPRGLVPPPVPVEVVHGRADDLVPLEVARSYVDAARVAGDTARVPGNKISFSIVDDADHFDVIDPMSTCWPVVVKSIESVMQSVVQPVVSAGSEFVNSAQRSAR